MARTPSRRKARRTPGGSSRDVNPRVERAHERFLRSWAAKVNSVQRKNRKAIERVIVAEQNRLGTFREDSARRDQESTRAVDRLMRKMVDEYNALEQDDRQKSRVRATAIEVSLDKTSGDAWVNNIISLVDRVPGIEAEEQPALEEFVVENEPDIPDPVRRRWISDQLDLIKVTQKVRVLGGFKMETIPSESFRKVREAITDGILKGTRVESIMKRLSELEGITARRAEVIARDQIGKQNGRMQRIRDEEIGVTHYIWMTVGDGRVRDKHKARNRKRYSYKKGPPNGENPGMEIQCRCWASPDLRGALRRLRKEKRKSDAWTRVAARMRAA